MTENERAMVNVAYIIDSRGQAHYGFTFVFRDGTSVRRIVPTRTMLVSDEAKSAFTATDGSQHDKA